MEALKTLGLESGRGASKLGKVLSAHNKMADALIEMRNEHDPIAHGKEGFLDTLTTNECRAFLVTADTILALILAAYEGNEPDLRFTREPYERFARFHDRVDQATRLTLMWTRRRCRNLGRKAPHSNFAGGLLSSGWNRASCCTRSTAKCTSNSWHQRWASRNCRSVRSRRTEMPR